MTRGAGRLMPEEMLSALCRLPVEAARRRLRHGQSLLVVEQRCKFWRNQIWRLPDRQTGPRIAEAAVTTHLSDSNVAIPVGDWTVGRERLEADPLQPEDRWDDDRQRRAVQWNQVDSVECVMAWVVLAGAPRSTLRLERVRHHRRQGDDGSDV